MLFPAANPTVGVLDSISEGVSDVPEEHHQQGHSNQSIDDSEELSCHGDDYD